MICDRVSKHLDQRQRHPLRTCPNGNRCCHVAASAFADNCYTERVAVKLPGVGTNPLKGRKSIIMCCGKFVISSKAVTGQHHSGPCGIDECPRRAVVSLVAANYPATAIAVKRHWKRARASRRVYRDRNQSCRACTTDNVSMGLAPSAASWSSPACMLAMGTDCDAAIAILAGSVVDTVLVAPRLSLMARTMSCRCIRQ